MKPGTDSTIAPPKKKRRFSLTRVPWLLDTRNDAMKNTASCIFFVWKGISNDNVGVARGAVFQEVRPGSGFKTGDFVKEKIVGVTVERLPDYPN